MTEKHIWENGETITADLLNAMSDYVDDKASTAVKTAETAAALTSDENLLTGTSAEWQTNMQKAAPNDSWFSVTRATNGDDVPFEIGKTYSYRVVIKPALDSTPLVIATVTNDAGTSTKQFQASVIKAGEVGEAVVTYTVPEGTTRVAVYPIRAQSMTATTEKTYWQWKEEKLNLGPYPTPYSKRAVTSVGGQQAGSDGDIDMDAYLLKNDLKSSLASREYIPANSDLNMYTSAGNFQQINNSAVAVTKNVPFGTMSYFLDVLVANGYFVQVAYSYQGDQIATRGGTVVTGPFTDEWTLYVRKTEFDELNSTVKALQSQISGGGD